MRPMSSETKRKIVSKIDIEFMILETNIIFKFKYNNYIISKNIN